MIIDFADGSTWFVPEGWTPKADERPGFCRSCGAHVLWLVSRNQRRAPFNHDGTSHFSDCPQADQWRRPR